MINAGPRNSQWTLRKLITTGVIAAFAAFGSVAVLGSPTPAAAAPYIDCSPTVYNGKVSSSTKCHAASGGSVRLKVECWNQVGVPYIITSKYTNWQFQAAGTVKTYTFNSGGWCTDWNQLWKVRPEFR